MKKLNQIFYFPRNRRGPLALYSSFAAPSSLAHTLSRSLTIVFDSLLCSFVRFGRISCVPSLVRRHHSKRSSQSEKQKIKLRREMRVNFVAIKNKGRRTASSLLFAQKETILLTQLTNTNDIQIYTRTHSYRLNHTKIKRLCECLRSLISSSYTNKSNEKQITKQTQI